MCPDPSPQSPPEGDPPEHDSDADELLARARSGDSRALQELLERGRGRLRARVRARMGDALKAKIEGSDIIQSTYMDVVRGIRDFSGSTESDFSNWVATILENNIRNKVRYFQAAKRERSRETTGHDLRDVAPSSGQSTPSSVLQSVEELEMIGAAMARIKEEHARILLLQTRSEMDAQARAKAMGRSIGATRVLLARARAALLAEIERIRKERGAGE